MTSNAEDSGGFTVAVVINDSPVEVSFQGFGPGIDPDSVFHPESTPKGSYYPFDLSEADDAIDDAGFEATGTWLWTGQRWGIVVQPRPE